MSKDLPILFPIFFKIAIFYLKSFLRCKFLLFFSAFLSNKRLLDKPFLQFIKVNRAHTPLIPSPTCSATVHQGLSGTLQIYAPDTPLVYMEEMRYHSIVLCDNKEENNQRDVYSWIINNTWETNFRMDLSGFNEFCYHLEVSDSASPQDCFTEMEEKQHNISAIWLNRKSDKCFCKIDLLKKNARKAVR
jgi:hypothetical protein